MQLVDVQGLAAVTSAVEAAEFSEAALAENTSDAAWLGRKALAHQAVLDRLTAAGCPIVPFRFGAIYVDRAHVQRLLVERRDALAAALGRVDGSVELGVKGTLELARATPAARGGSDTLSGAEYLRRRKAELGRDSALEATALARARALHSALADAAAEARANAPREAEREGELPVLNGAYLVRRSDEARFRELVDRLAAESAEAGLRLEVTGPWPPYNFVSDEVGR